MNPKDVIPGMVYSGKIFTALPKLSPILSLGEFCPKCNYNYSQQEIEQIKSLYTDGRWWRVCRYCSEKW